MAYLGGSATLEGEISRLRTENHALAEDLAQCQADKEFVWSLWKRLQVASPDITQAIGMVVQREKEKAEMKDRKVLDILAAKDDRIDELQKVIAAQGSEVSAILSKKMELSDTVSHMIAENEELKLRQSHLQQKIDDFEKRAAELGEKEDMARSLTKKDEELDSVMKDKRDLAAIKDSQKQRLATLEDQLEETRDDYSRASKENANLKKDVHGHERVIRELQRDFDHKDRELEAVRKEMSELWENHRQLTDHASQQAHLIQQLRSLQTDTQKMMKNQEDAFSMESSTIYKLYSELKSKYSILLTTERETKNELSDSKQRVLDQDKEITELRRQVHDSQNRSVSTQASLEDKEIQAFRPEEQIEYRLQSMQTEINSLKDRIKHKDRIIDGMEWDELPMRSSSPLRSSEQEGRAGRRSASERRRRRRDGSPGDRSAGRSRARSWSPSADQRGAPGSLQQKLQHCERRLEDCRTLLKHRTAELEETRAAHGRRLERLKALQTNHRLCRKQLKALEEEVNGPVKKRKKPKRTTDPKALQRENSDAVWNELAYFKTEHKNLLVEKMNLQEEVDTQRVQSAHDAATVHELRTCLEQEKEELAFLLEQQRPSSPSDDLNVQLEEALGAASSAQNQLTTSQRQADELSARLKRAEDNCKSACKRRDALYEEKRALKGEVNTLRQQVADRRMDITDLKRDLLRAERELRKKKKKEKQKPNITKQYQQVLNRSIQTMSNMFEDFDKEGWEEISESSQNDLTATTDVTQTTDSLGAAIAYTARSNSPAKDRQRPGQRNESPEREGPGRRDQALSPITVPGVSQPCPRGHVVSKKTTPSPAGRQLNTLRQRVTSLQKEVSILKDAKNAAVKKEAEQRRTLEVLQGDLQLANHRLSSSRSTCQRLNGELERLRAAKEDLETQVDVAAVSSTPQVCTEQEYHSLQARLKTSSTELSKQLAQLKEVKVENETLTEKIQTLTNKLNHVERDLSQKRILVDDLKFKIKMAQESAQTDTEVMVEADGKIKQLSETNSRYKTQMESTQQRIAAIGREKRENEQKVIKLSQELEKKSKLLSDVQKKNRDLESALSQIEKTAEQQLLRLAEQSEAAMDAAQAQLRLNTIKLNEFNKFIKVMAHSVVNSVHQARSLLRQHERRPREPAPSKPPNADPCLAQAQRLAADILHMSQSEVDDLMSVHEKPAPTLKEEDQSQDVESKKDKRWTKKCEKTLANKKEFCMPLVELFMEKLEERCKLAAKLSSI